MSLTLESAVEISLWHIATLALVLGVVAVALLMFKYLRDGFENHP